MPIVKWIKIDGYGWMSISAFADGRVARAFYPYGAARWIVQDPR